MAETLAMLFSTLCLAPVFAILLFVAGALALSYVADRLDR